MGAILGAVAGAAIVGSTVAGVVEGNAKEDAAGSRFDHAFAAADAANKAASRAEELALPSPRELQALEGSLRAQEITIAREQKLIEAVDPAIMEAGKQAYDMLQGKEAETLAPIRRQRERQKQQLRETLRRQLGPGFETSSAGIEAMSRFETETADLMAQTQQRAINDFLGVAQNASSVSKQTEAAAQGKMLATGEAFGNIQKRRASAAQFTAAQFLEGGKLIDAAASGQVAAAGSTASAVGQGFGQVAKFAGYAGGFSPDKIAGKGLADEGF